MLAEQTCREAGACMIGIVRTERTGNFCRRGERRSSCSHRDASAEGTVAIGRRAYAALYLDAAQKRRITVHVSPENGLVFRRVECHAVQCYVDAASCSTTNTHIAGTCADTIFAPSQDARSTRKEEWEFQSGTGELLEFSLLEIGYGVRRILIGTYSLNYYFIQILHLGGVQFGLSHGSLSCQ